MPTSQQFRGTLIPGPPSRPIFPCVPRQPGPSPALVELAIGRRWVLVIDDDRMSGRATARFIQGVGLKARVAGTVQQAVYLSQSELPPVGIVADFQLGDELNGVELLGKFRQWGLCVPAVLLTGARRLAGQALSASGLAGEVPVLERGAHLGRLLEWLFPLGAVDPLLNADVWPA